MPEKFEATWDRLDWVLAFAASSAAAFWSAMKSELPSFISTIIEKPLELPMPWIGGGSMICAAAVSRPPSAARALPLMLPIERSAVLRSLQSFRTT